jgi:hypothetical protein
MINYAFRKRRKRKKNVVVTADSQLQSKAAKSQAGKKKTKNDGELRYISERRDNSRRQRKAADSIHVAKQEKGKNKKITERQMIGDREINKAADREPSEKKAKTKNDGETNDRRQSNKAADREPSAKKAKTKNNGETNSRRQSNKAADREPSTKKAKEKEKTKKMTKRQILINKAR